MSLTLESPAFIANALIPGLYTCDGLDRSPALTWRDAPAGTQSWALIMDDPDAPGGTWDHWLLFNMPAVLEGLDEATELPAGAVSCKNSWGKTGYGGPCPPSGTHRYIFKLYALDTQLSLDSSANKQALLNAMEGHVLASSQLTGLYKRE